MHLTTTNHCKSRSLAARKLSWLHRRAASELSEPGEGRLTLWHPAAAQPEEQRLGTPVWRESGLAPPRPGGAAAREAWAQTRVLYCVVTRGGAEARDGKDTFCGDGFIILRSSGSLRWACLGSKTVLACSFNGVTVILSME